MVTAWGQEMCPTITLDRELLPTLHCFQASIKKSSCLVGTLIKYLAIRKPDPQRSPDSSKHRSASRLRWIMALIKADFLHSQETKHNAKITLIVKGKNMTNENVLYV